MSVALDKTEEYCQFFVSLSKVRVVQKFDKYRCR